MGVVFTPRDEEVYKNSSGTLYPRVMELHHAGDLNGLLLATFDHSTVKEPPVVPIMASSDGGVTWEKYGQIEDTQNGYGIRFQPVMYELPQAVRRPARGHHRVLRAIPCRSTSRRRRSPSTSAATTARRGSSALPSSKGGPPVEQNFDALGPVWEPCIYLNAYGELTIALTDERPHTDPRFNQTLGLSVSKDGGRTWSDVQYTVTVPDRKLRPGMPVVDPHGQRQVHHGVRDRRLTPSATSTYKLSDDGVDWGDPLLPGRRVETADGLYLGQHAVRHLGAAGRREAARSSSPPSARGEHIGMRDPGYYHVNYNLRRGAVGARPHAHHLQHGTRLQAGWSMGMCTVGEDRLIQLAPTPMNRRLMQITYGIGKLETVK